MKSGVQPIVVDLRQHADATGRELDDSAPSLLVWSKQPLVKLGLALIKGPSVYLTWVTNAQGPAFEIPANDPKQHGWCKDLHALQREPTAPSLRWALLEKLRNEIFDELLWEEREAHPLLDNLLATERVTRELRYEHDGIRRYLGSAKIDIFECKRAWSQFSLDCIHLIEHNIERKYRSTVPILRCYFSPEKRKRLEEWLRR